MYKVGLTGNLYSGYEDVAIQFKKLGVPVFDADIVSKFMIHYDELVSREIRIRFGESAFQHGFLNEKTFNTTPKLELLLDTINKKLIQSWERFRLKYIDSDYVIFKYALLFERSVDTSMDYTICSFKPKEERILSLKESEGLPFIEAYSLIENGPDDIEKNKLATYIVHNYPEAQSLETQVAWIHKKISSKLNLVTT
jgi:dephospho-CoA kinase